MSDTQASAARDLIAKTGVALEYASLPDAAHAMHFADPRRFADVVAAWAKKLPAEAVSRQR